MRNNILYLVLAVSLFLAGCGKAAPAHGSEGEYAGESDEINTEIAADSLEDAKDRTGADLENGEETEDSAEEVLENWKKNTANVIVGTWKNIPDPEKEWMTSYRTCFSADGRTVHYGFRNVDFGTWTQDGDICTACFDDCMYIGIDGKRYELPSYTVTFQVFYSEDGEEMLLDRNTDREAEIVLELEIEQGTEHYTATDHDDYRCPLYYESDFSEVHDFECGSYYWPKITEYGDLIGQGLLDMAEALSERDAEEEWEALPCTLEKVLTFDFTGDGRKEIFVYVESFVSYWTNEGAVYILSPAEEGGYTILAENMDFRGGYTDILAPDGTELLSLGYNAPSSWKGGVRYHLGYREGQIVVDKKESYDFHWDLPLINYVNDFENGTFYVYVARNPLEGSEYLGRYIDTKDSIKIDEETFEPVFLPFSRYKVGGNNYPAAYFSFHPFPEGWWQNGGRYPEDAEEYYGEDYDYCVDGHYVPGIADWIDKAKDDDPDEMLREAVEKSGYQMERVAYPWTEETKKNVTELLRCPVADYYYISDDHAAYYALGEIRFVEIGE